MTTIEHMMLASVFGCVWGWLLGSIIFIVADLIHTAIRKLHSAALGGHRCGHQRPPCGAAATRN